MAVTAISTKKDIWSAYQKLKKDFRALEKQGLKNLGLKEKVKALESDNKALKTRFRRNKQRLVDLITDSIDDYPQDKQEEFAKTAYSLAIKFLADSGRTFHEQGRMKRVTRANQIYRHLITAGIESQFAMGYLADRKMGDFVNKPHEASAIDQIPHKAIKDIEAEIEIFDGGIK